jgi:hypothetical protein
MRQGVLFNNKESHVDHTSTCTVLTPHYVFTMEDYLLDYPSDHPDLNITAADIEAIGSSFDAPLPSRDDASHGNNTLDPSTVDHGYNHVNEEDVDDGDFLPIPEEPDSADPAGKARSRRAAGDGLKGLTSEEKKRRTKESNKKAAERSRSKRRKEM